MYDAAAVAALRAGAAAVAVEWGLAPDAAIHLLNLSENATFLAEDGDRRIVLRVHRPGYHSVAEIESEHLWIEALRAEGVVATPAPLRTQTGARLARLTLADGGVRQVAAFAFQPGREPAPDEDLRDAFATLGALTARLHGWTQAWRAPPGFTRKIWDFDACLGTRPLWGDWRAAIGLTPPDRALLARTAVLIQRRLAAFGRGPARFGLIHADLRLANLLIAEGISVIDFDDCGYGWRLYDFAAAISFMEDSPQIPALRAAWLEGYRRIAAIPAEDEAELDSFVMLRRMLLTAWLASHAETPTAQALNPAYAAGTVALAEDYLTRFG